VVVPYLRTVTAVCPAVHTFLEHLLMVVADTADILTGRWRTITGQRPHSQKAAAPRPATQRPPEGPRSLVEATEYEERIEPLPGNSDA
jgi:hypothetical protein